MRDRRVHQVHRNRWAEWLLAAVVCFVLAVVLSMADRIGFGARTGLAAWQPLPITAGILATVVGLASGLYARSSRGRIRHQYGTVGWARRRELARTFATPAVRAKSRRVRPQLAQHHAVRWAHPCEFGPMLGTTTTGPFWPRAVRVPYSDSVLAFAPPQTGKSSAMVPMINEAPGAAVVPSPKVDNYVGTVTARQAIGPVYTFNPEGIGGIESTLPFSLLAGCQDPMLAEERATHMVDGSKSSGGLQDAGFWNERAIAVLRVLLLIAAVAGERPSTVAKWANDPRNEEAVTLADAYRGQVPDHWRGELQRVIDMKADRTRESIFLTLRAALAFMGQPAVAAVCDLPANYGFDVASFLEQRGTLYLFGSDKTASVAPLLSALTGYIFEETKRQAAQRSVAMRRGRLRPGFDHITGRMDPPLALFLDEAPQITPLPLPQWTADAGGRSVFIMIAIQAWSQLADRWGSDGANTIKTNANVKLIFQGATVQRDLEEIALLTGYRRVEHRSQQDNPRNGPLGGGNRSITEEPLLRPGDVRTLPDWHALVIHRGASPMLLRIRTPWQRRPLADWLPRRQAGFPLDVPPVATTPASAAPPTPVANTAMEYEPASGSEPSVPR